MKRPALAELAPKYDIIIIGGGITGAGVLHEAARSGAKALLLEQNDFASGTSAGSSKLVHGGLRYLRTGQWRLTRESVRERERLLNEAPDLVEKQPFMIPVYRGEKPGKFALSVGLWIYDSMGGSTSLWVDAAEALRLESDIRGEGLLGAMLFDDARTNDARLVLTLITQACTAGATARNYTRVESLLRDGDRVRGVAIRDADGATRELEASLVVDATGVRAGSLGKDGAAPKLRPLRGSHFVFAHKRLPVLRAVSWLHPRDRRPVFAYPWENVTLCGTTDVDHDAPADAPWRMSAAESEYLVDGLAHQFPKLGLKAADALCSFSAVRPVVAGGKAAASDESRESSLWTEPGLVGVTGGKLTTFRLTAKRVLQEAGRQLPNLAPADRTVTMFKNVSTAMRTQTRNVEEVSLAGSKYSLAKVRWAARHEQVRHLDDVMLRRTRLGLVTPGGGRPLLSGIAGVLRQELGWDDQRWREEERRYLALWDAQHAPVAVQ